MKKFRACYGWLFLLIFSLSNVQCKKVKEDIGKRFIINAMTDGLWVVQAFTDEDVDITSGFIGFEFQFKEDGKVFAINTATTEQVVGNWEGNVNDLTIFSDFPGTSEPLIRLNDTWKITNNTTKLVEAKPFNSSRKAYLKLVKKT